MENFSEKISGEISIDKVLKLQKIRQWYKDYKKGKQCKICPENDSRCLDFHHIEPKKKRMSISKMVSSGKNKCQILREIKKCEVLCSNCHRKHHSTIHKTTQSALQKWLYKIKQTLRCKVCEENTSCCLDFHHLNPEIKKFAIGDICKMRNVTKEEILEEMEKCEIMCSNCHRKYHII